MPESIGLAQDAERDKEREVMRAAKQEWQQRQMEAFRNRRQVEGEKANPGPAPSPLDAAPVYAPGKFKLALSLFLAMF